MKSAKVAEIRPVPAITSIPDAIAAATYILTGSARMGRNVNRVGVGGAIVTRNLTNWSAVYSDSGASPFAVTAPTFWQVLYEMAQKKPSLNFANYLVLESSAMGAQYDSRREGLSPKPKNKENKGRRQAR